MPRPQILTALALTLCAIAPAGELPPLYEQAGERALGYVREAVAFGPRPAGSKAQAAQQKWILAELSRLECAIEEVDFTARTPHGPLRMKNIVAKFGEGEPVLVVSGHYDTYHRDGLRFVGANDGGSSTGFLLALGELLSKSPSKGAVWLAFFDGEESVVSWRNDDHTYGSRHQAAQWLKSGDQQRIKAVINVDMIGDADLAIEREAYSTPWLRELIWETADRLGHGEHFRHDRGQYVEDDHVPFLKAGYAAVDLIDFRYGLLNRFWHTEADTVDKLSAESLGIVLHVIDESLKKLGEHFD